MPIGIARMKFFHVGATPPRCVRHARQGLAIDEVRYDFRPEIWLCPADDSQTLEQRWFAGVHSNVGGGYVDDGLANLALQWMLTEAKTSGLIVDKKYLGNYHGYAQDRLYRSESVLYRGFDAVRGRAGRGRRERVDWPESSRFSLDPSVIRRIQADPKEKNQRHPDQLRHPELKTLYRPDNVFRFLAIQPNVEGIELPADVVKRLQALRASTGEQTGLLAHLVRPVQRIRRAIGL